MDSEGTERRGWEQRANRFSAWFRQTLAEKHLSQSDVARRLHDHDGSKPMTTYRTRVNEWYHGRQVPTLENAEDLARVLDIEADFVLRMAGRVLGLDDGDLSDRQLEVIALVKASDFTEVEWASIVAMFEFWRSQKAAPSPGANHDGG